MDRNISSNHVYLPDVVVTHDVCHDILFNLQPIRFSVMQSTWLTQDSRKWFVVQQSFLLILSFKGLLKLMWKLENATQRCFALMLGQTESHWVSLQTTKNTRVVLRNFYFRQKDCNLISVQWLYCTCITEIITLLLIMSYRLNGIV